MVRLPLELLEETFAVAVLPPGEPTPAWALCESGPLFLARTDEELSIICPQWQIPEEAEAERDYRALRVVGALDFDLVGVLASLSSALADASIPLLAVSTYRTDYLLLAASDLRRGLEALERAGWRLLRE